MSTAKPATPLPCAFCKSVPYVSHAEMRFDTPWTKVLGRNLFSVHCVNPKCPPRNPRKKSILHWAIRAWNGSQSAQKSVINRYRLAQKLEPTS